VTPAKRPIGVELFTRPGCHLCEEMKEHLAKAARGLEIRLSEVDVSVDGDLEARFGEDVPVLFIEGKLAFKHRASEEDLRRRLLSQA
jgi:glutaredoxin